MAANETALRLRFLQNSASLLSASGVSTAAHLMTLHNRLIHADSKPLKPRQHESWCAACGSPRDSAHTKVSKSRQRVISRKHDSESRDILEEVVVYHCLRCHKRTTRRLQSHAQKKRELSNTCVDAPPKTAPTNQHLSTASTTQRPSPNTTNSSSTLETVKPASDNANSKKRAKARKQSGLQALMASKQRSQASNAGSSLDLLDFLQH